MTDRGLERRHPFIELAPENISDLVAAAIGGNTVTGITRLVAGRVNSNYKLSLSEPPYTVVLRLYARGAEVCRLERDVLKLLESRIAVPKLLHDGAAAQTPYLLLSWIGGEPLVSALEAGRGAPEKLGQAVGNELARIHGTTTFTEHGFLGDGAKLVTPFGSGGSVFLTFLREALHGRAAQRLGATLTARLSRFAEEMATHLDGLPQSACLVHSDFNPPNLRVDGDRLTGVLDWEFAHAGTPLTDIANMLRPRPYQPETFNAAFLAAYEEVAGPLPDDWQALSRLADLMAQVELLDAPEDRPNIVAWATERVVATIDFVESRLGRS